MKSVFVLFNGIRFPFDLMDKSIQWANENQATLTAIFLHSAAQDDEGYGFPSDIDAAKDLKDEEDARESNEKLLRRYIKLLRDGAAAKKVQLTIISKEDNSKDEIIDLIKNADKLFVDDGPDQGTIPWGIRKFAMSELVITN